MADPAPGAAPGAAPPGAAPGSAPPAWHAGVEADTIGFWQNKGYTLDSPKELATELTKQYRELERHFGVPPDQLAKFPTATSKPEDIKAFYNKLGVPSEAKDYDFSGVQFDGEALAADFADVLRGAFMAANVPKDRAATMATSILKYFEDADIADATARAGKVSLEKAELEKNWGPNTQYNLMMADNGARRFGINAEEFTKLGEVLGIARTSEMFRKIGEGFKEDNLVPAGTAPGQGAMPRTQEGAQQRLNELRKNSDWTNRIIQGKATPAELEEFYSLNAMVAGENRII